MFSRLPRPWVSYSRTNPRSAILCLDHIKPAIQHPYGEASTTPTSSEEQITLGTLTLAHLYLTHGSLSAVLQALAASLRCLSLLCCHVYPEASFHMSQFYAKTLPLAGHMSVTPKLSRAPPLKLFMRRTRLVSTFVALFSTGRRGQKNPDNTSMSAQSNCEGIDSLSASS